MDPLVLTLPELAQTHAVAAALAPALRAGDAILLDGPLGVGKTAFVQGLARALGVDAPVTSPTFAIANLYPGGRLPLVHVDAYRLKSVDLFRDLALEEQLESGVACVEWGERVAAAFPEHLALQLECDAEGVRHLAIAGHGERWRDGWRALASAIEGSAR